MEKRELVELKKGWGEEYVDYIAFYENGTQQKATCSKKEWDIWEIKSQLVESGADEKLVEDLSSLSWDDGYYIASSGTDY